ncbi:hypothetical protein D3C71_1950560 [compost metagenome]
MAQCPGGGWRVEVGTRAEAASGTGQHHRANLRITGLVPGIAELEVQLGIERVQRLRAVECHQQHRALAFAQDGAHSAAPVPRMAVTWLEN